MIVAYLSCLVLYFALNRLLRKKSFSEKSILFTIKTFLGLALLVLSAISFFVSEWWVGIVFIVISLEQLKSAGGKCAPAAFAAISSLICLLLFGPSNFILPSLMITVFLLTLLRNKLAPKEVGQDE